MKTTKGHIQSVSTFQTIARRRTVTAWLQAAQIEDRFRQAFYAEAG